MTEAEKRRRDHLAARVIYLQWLRRSPVNPPILRDSRLPRRFWKKVEVFHTGCWLWKASLDGDGYGQFSWKAKYGKTNLRAHRVAYEAIVGFLPDTLTIDHLCRVRCCVNPLHLEPVTGAENNARSPLPEGRRFAGIRSESCPRGHAMTADNTRANGGCRQCQCDRKRAARQALRNTANST